MPAMHYACTSRVMPRSNRNDAPVAIDIPEAEIREIDLDGYMLNFNTLEDRLRPGAAVTGLPGDACNWPWAPRRAWVKNEFALANEAGFSRVDCLDFAENPFNIFYALQR